MQYNPTSGNVNTIKQAGRSLAPPNIRVAFRSKEYPLVWVETRFYAYVLSSTCFTFLLQLFIVTSLFPSTYNAVLKGKKTSKFNFEVIPIFNVSVLDLNRKKLITTSIYLGCFRYHVTPFYMTILSNSYNFICAVTTLFAAGVCGRSHFQDFLNVQMLFSRLTVSRVE